MAKSMAPDTIIAFTHVFRSGGTTLRHLLRRHFGLKHIDTEPRLMTDEKVMWREIYAARDLRVDLKIYPRARSIAGHAIKPFQDYGESQDRLAWYTILRDPIKRYVSLYQYWGQIGSDVPDFRTWMQEFKGENFYVRWIAGNNDLEAAKQIILEKFGFIGILEHYNESLLIMRQRLGLKGFNPVFKKPLNVAANNPGKAQKDVKERIHEYRDQIIEHNELDIKLYEFVLNEIWPKQVAEYGEEKLAQDLESEFGDRNPTIGDRLRLASAFAYRQCVYKPLVKWDRKRLQKSMHKTAL